MEPDLERMDFREALATCCGLGYGPKMPGTFGTLAGLADFCILEGLRMRFGFSPIISTVILFILAVATSAIGISLGAWAEEFFGRKDPQPFVLDEVAGFFVTVFLLPVLFPDVSLWITAGVGFSAARIFDIIKPPPARRIEKLPRGWGIVLDDVASGVYSAAFSCLILAGLSGGA